MAWRAGLCGLLLALAPAAAFAHKPSDSKLSLRAEGRELRGQWDVALRDLDFALGLDADGDGRLTWGELRARAAEVDALALASRALRAAGAPCAARVGEHLVDRHSDGADAVLRLAGACPQPPARLELDYRLFAALDPQHRGLVRIEGAGGVEAAVLGGPRPAQSFALAAPSAARTLASYTREGVRHIAIGFDHVLFLLSLLLPMVLRREAGRWAPEPRLAPVALDVLRVVSAFTLAHSLTLSLAALGVLGLPARLVEAAIAGSVVLAAVNNLRPHVGSRRWLAALGFGLLHGLGFASVLSDLGLAGAPLVPALIGFNLGVELGQLALVAAFLPVAWWLRATVFYRSAVLAFGSALIAVLGAVWLVERSLDVRLLASF